MPGKYIVEKLRNNVIINTLSPPPHYKYLVFSLLWRYTGKSEINCATITLCISIFCWYIFLYAT